MGIPNIEQLFRSEYSINYTDQGKVVTICFFFELIYPEIRLKF